MTLSEFLNSNPAFNEFEERVVILTPNLAEIFVQTFNDSPIANHSANPRQLADGGFILPATLFYVEGNSYRAFIDRLPDLFMGAEVKTSDQVTGFLFNPDAESA